MDKAESRIYRFCISFILTLGLSEFWILLFNGILCGIPFIIGLVESASNLPSGFQVERHVYL